MIEEYLRPPYQRYLVNPLAKRLGEQLKPNHITLLSASLGLLVLPALLLNHPWLAIALMLLSGYCDSLDGTLARFYHQSSDWGTTLDIMSDRLVEFVIVLALWTIAPEERSLWIILMLGSMLLCISSFLVVGIFSINQSEKSFHYSPGLMERAEAFFFFILMILWPQAFMPLALLFTVLVSLTAAIRLRQFYQQQP